MMKSVGFALILAILVVFQIDAATGWDRLSDLHAGDRITVVRQDGTRQRGEFASVTPASLAIRTGSGDQTIQRRDITRVHSNGKSKALRNMAIGAGAGVAASVTTDRTLGARLYNEGGYDNSAKALVWILPAAIGATIGFLSGRNPVIYKAP